MTQSNLPPTIDTEEQLEDLLSEPTRRVVETFRKLEGDLIFLGVGGKMGPTLARMAQRADQEAGSSRRIIGASRFSDPEAKTKLEQWGIETITCDLLEAKELQQLPDAPNVVCMSGMKFGTTGQESRTWAMNAYLPGAICEKYQNSRMLAFSTGNVYGLSPVSRGGSLESDPLQPVGEYAWSRLGGERICEHFSEQKNIPMALLRLNYAHELRYGVMVDIALRVYHEETIHLAMGNLNVIWQGDANAMSLCAFAHVSSPPFILNIAGPESLSVKQIATTFGDLLNKPVRFSGEEDPTAFLSNGQVGQDLYGYPRVGPLQLMRWIAQWVRNNGRFLGKPTHFELRDGNY